MDKYIHNKSGVTKTYLGTEIPDTAFYLIPNLENFKYMVNEALITDLTSGDAAMSIDGATDLDIPNSLLFLAYHAEAFDQRFQPDPERPNGFVSKNVQEAIEELSEKGPRFLRGAITYGRSGNLASGTWLLNETVPSNRAGRLVPTGITNIVIAEIRFTSEDLDTYDIGVYEHDGDEVGLSLIKTFSVVASRGVEIFDGVTTLTAGKHIGLKITSGSAKNLLATVVVSGLIPV